MAAEPDLATVKRVLRECGNDFTLLFRTADELGFAATFVPMTTEGQPALAFGVWQGCDLERSPDGAERAIAAVLYCTWTRG